LKRLNLDNTWPKSWKESHFYDLQEAYGQISHRGYAYAYANRRRHTLALVTEVLPPGTRVLDIAAAQGNFSIALAEMGYDVTWNDLRAELADYVRLKHENGILNFAPGNAFELSFERPFDAVLITEIIEHVAHPDEFLVKAANLVRPGGYIIMTTPNGAYIRNRLPKFSECLNPALFESEQFKPNADGHIFLLHPEELGALAAHAGLEVEKTVLFTNSLTAGHMKLESILHALPKGSVNQIEKLSSYLPKPLKKRLLVQMAARFRKLFTGSVKSPGISTDS
jgi:2-polyprenyl-3-methyl-5-hydroxy-6-metoxy-1,4-benzoquinol methylase